MSNGGYTIEDLRAAFKAGWDERNKHPGLKRQTRGTLKNVLGLHTRGGDDASYMTDTKKYHNSVWLNSRFKKGLK